MTAYVYIRSEPGLWTVGFYDPNERWEPESDHTSADDAAQRVSYLNGARAERAEAAPTQQSSDIKNKMCIDGHLNRSLDAVLRSTSPDETFAVLTELAHKAVDVAMASERAEAAQRVPLTEAVSLLRQAHDALAGMADSDLDYFEDEEEEAEAVPAQYAARKVMQAIQLLTATEPQGEQP